jgi:hypothetical protein
MSAARCLSISIKRDDEGCASQQRELDAGLERRSLPKIDRVAEHDRTGLRRNSGRRVGRLTRGASGSKLGNATQDPLSKPKGVKRPKLRL